jgi:hypothetical protein
MRVVPEARRHESFHIGEDDGGGVNDPGVKDLDISRDKLLLYALSPRPYPPVSSRSIPAGTPVRRREAGSRPHAARRGGSAPFLWRRRDRAATAGEETGLRLKDDGVVSMASVNEDRDQEKFSPQILSPQAGEERDSDQGRWGGCGIGTSLGFSPSIEKKLSLQVLYPPAAEETGLRSRTMGVGLDGDGSPCRR